MKDLNEARFAQFFQSLLDALPSDAKLVLTAVKEDALGMGKRFAKIRFKLTLPDKTDRATILRNWIQTEHLEQVAKVL